MAETTRGTPANKPKIGIKNEKDIKLLKGLWKTLQIAPPPFLLFLFTDIYTMKNNCMRILAWNLKLIYQEI